jgi:hypothetical protein
LSKDKGGDREWHQQRDPQRAPDRIRADAGSNRTEGIEGLERDLEAAKRCLWFRSRVPAGWLAVWRCARAHERGQVGGSRLLVTLNRQWQLEASKVKGSLSGRRQARTEEPAQRWTDGGQVCRLQKVASRQDLFATQVRASRERCK